MRKEQVVFSILAAAFIAFLFAASPVPAPAADPIKLNYSIFFPAPHKNTVLGTEWAQEIEKRTNGAVKITMFPGGTLTPADKCYDGVVKGIADAVENPAQKICGYSNEQRFLLETHPAVLERDAAGAFEHLDHRVSLSRFQGNA
jgi:TRAP-type C4-dicarboxylate transport system substrate-binding protein